MAQTPTEKFPESGTSNAFSPVSLSRGKHLLADMIANDSTSTASKYRRVSSPIKYSRSPIKFIAKQGSVSQSSSPKQKSPAVDFNSNKSRQISREMLEAKLLSSFKKQPPSFVDERTFPSPSFLKLHRSSSNETDQMFPSTSISASISTASATVGSGVLASFKALSFRKLEPVSQALDKTSQCSKFGELEVKRAYDNVKDVTKEQLVEKLRHDVLMLKKIRKHGLVHWGGKDVQWSCLGQAEENLKQEKNEIVSTDLDWEPNFGIGSRTRLAKTRMTAVDTRDFYGPEEFSDTNDFKEDNLMKATESKPFKIKKNFIDDTDDELEEESSKKGKGGKSKLDNALEYLNKKDDALDESLKDNAGKGRGKGRGGGKKGQGKKRAGAAKENKTPVVETIRPYLERNVNVEGAYGDGFLGKLEGKQKGTCPICNEVMDMLELELHAAECEGFCVDL